MVVDRNNVLGPCLACVLEVADQLALLGIDADDGLLLGDKLSTQRVDVIELRIPIWVVGSMEGLGGGARTDLHVSQQASDGLCTQHKPSGEQRAD